MIGRTDSIAPRIPSDPGARRTALQKASSNTAARRACALLITVASMIMTGCDSTEIDPFLESDRYFTIYGSLDMDFRVQHLRVIPIDTLIGASDDSIDARVTSTDLQTGQLREWRDSVFTFDDGTVGHIYTSTFRIEAGHTYRVEVERSDGAVTWAETTVPAEPESEMGESLIPSPQNRSFPFGFQRIFWRGLTEEPHRVDVYYRYKSADDEPFIDIRVPYGTESSSDDTRRGWEITVRYNSDRQVVDEQVQNRPWRLVGVGMRIVVVTDDWRAPGGIWDPEILSQPGVFSNVNNGFGFVGSSGRFSIEWIP